MNPKLGPVPDFVVTKPEDPAKSPKAYPLSMVLKKSEAGERHFFHPHFQEMVRQFSKPLSRT